MKVFVVFLSVLGTALAASLPLDKTPDGKGDAPVGDIGTRIVGGYNVTIEGHPFIVSLQKLDITSISFYYYHTCGGATVTASKVVTAAHCVLTPVLKSTLRSPALLRVVAGTTYYARGGQIIDAEIWIAHPFYNPLTSANDIGLVHLETPLVFGLSVQAISLASSPVDPGTLVEVSGWGATVEGGPASPYLKAVTVPVQANGTCYNSYNNFKNESMLCAGYPEGGKDSCQGDSRGPLTFLDLLLGLVSFGNGCAEPKYFGVYTFVPAFKTWIMSN